MRRSQRVTQTLIGFFLITTSIFAQGNDWVDTTVYTLINGGCWCWFQDERAVVDTTTNKLIIGATNMQNTVNVAIFDIENKNVDDLFTSNQLIKYQDDHNAPGLLITADGNYLAMWAHHYDEYNHTYSVYDGSGWSWEQKFNWSNIPGGTNYTIAYTNLCYLSDEERIYNFSRANDRAPNFLYSDDNGQNWAFGGQLTTNASSTYNKGYYKYWGNGKDRIDMCFTEQHPRDDTTSIYHGYIQDGKVYNTEGEVADDDIYDRDFIPTFDDFTKVFAHGTEVNGVTMGRCWQSDICRYSDSSIAILFYARADDDTLDHRNFYARYNGTKWNITYLGKTGRGIYDSEQDYTGLGALNPDDPNRIYLCTRYNPGNDSESPADKREIWRGTTEDHGATWEWEAVTANSTQDNFRPIVPQWKPGKEALLWFRADYYKAQDIRNSKVIGTFYEYEPPVTVTPKENTIGKTDAVTPLTLSASGGSIAVHYNVQEAAPVTLDIFDISGKRVATLVRSARSMGANSLNWNTAAVPTGTYLIRLSVGTVTYMERISVQH